MAKILKEDKIILSNNSGSISLTIPKKWAEMCGLVLDVTKEADAFLVLTRFGLGIHLCNKEHQIEKAKLELEL